MNHAAPSPPEETLVGNLVWLFWQRRNRHKRRAGLISLRTHWLIFCETKKEIIRGYDSTIWLNLCLFPARNCYILHICGFPACNCYILHMFGFPAHNCYILSICGFLACNCDILHICGFLTRNCYILRICKFQARNCYILHICRFPARNCYILHIFGFPARNCYILSICGFPACNCDVLHIFGFLTRNCYILRICEFQARNCYILHICEVYHMAHDGINLPWKGLSIGKIHSGRFCRYSFIPLVKRVNTGLFCWGGGGGGVGGRGFGTRFVHQCVFRSVSVFLAHRECYFSVDFRGGMRVCIILAIFTSTVHQEIFVSSASYIYVTMLSDFRRRNWWT